MPIVIVSILSIVIVIKSLTTIIIEIYRALPSVMRVTAGECTVTNIKCSVHL